MDLVDSSETSVTVYQTKHTFRKTIILSHYSSAMKMEVASSSEILVTIYDTTTSQNIVIFFVPSKRW
jgi:hypothetical protein